MHVTLESLVQYATLVTVVTGFVSLVVFARIYGKQVNAQIVIELFARYPNMHQSFPAQLRVALFGSDRSLRKRHLGHQRACTNPLISPSATRATPVVVLIVLIYLIRRWVVRT
jgi:ABC-type methionine transport system permease subunit